MGDEESEVIELLERKSKEINIIDDKWIPCWASLIEKYFKRETRNHIRFKAIALMAQIFSKYHIICEDDLMNKIILPNFTDADQENDSNVRKPIVHLLFDIASVCLSYKHCNAVLAIIRKILNKPYRQVATEESNGFFFNIGNKDIIDSRLIINSLNKLFRTKLYQLPIDPAVNILDISVNYLNLTYKCPLQEPTPAEIPMIRRELFELFLYLRCNKHGHLGVMFPDGAQNNIEYSPFIICVKKQRSLDQTPPLPESPTQPNPPLTPTNYPNHYQSIFVSNASQPNCPIESRCVDLDPMFAGIIECILHESDSDVLKLVLTDLPKLLANKHIVHCAANDRINQLCLALSDLIRPTKSSRLSSKFDVVKRCLNCFTSLLIYRKLLDNKSIRNMLAAFGESLRVPVSRHPTPSNVPLFTTCLIELQDSSEMAKFLPGVLDRFSTFSPTTNLGISMLEFLSYLILFPNLYADFSENDYKYIFAIALPYTNSFRFSDYITCLAFRVIAMWYLNCRPAHRYAFVELVKKSLQSNVLLPFKENSITTTIYSQTSSPITHTPPITYSCPATMSPVDQRKRSSSLNAENHLKQQGLALPNPKISLQVNEELIETFADLLSRYKQGQYLAITPKNRCLEFLLDRDSSRTWLHGNALITITSGCSNNGWAEIMVRRPTGNTSWVGRLQNSVCSTPSINQQVYLDSLNFENDVISLFSTMSILEDSLDSQDQTPQPSPSPSPSQISSSINSLVTANMSTSNAQNSHEPVLLPKDKKIDSVLSNFDYITPYETHKVGVIYVGRYQTEDRAAILSNTCGSPRYHEFLSYIGTCIILNDIDPEVHFIGGLDAKGDDGKYAYFWRDNLTQVIFHVATFMPVRENDPHCNNKNRHIGNDHVCIVYNNSGASFQLSTIKGTGQFIMACIVITPLEEDVTNIVEVEVLPNLKSIVGEIEPKVLSNSGASIYARQLSIHLSLASKIYQRHQCEGFHQAPYVSNWVERLRSIKRIRQRLGECRKSFSTSNTIARS